MKRCFETVRKTLRAFLDHNCGLHAAGLTYYTLLSLIPILCCVLVLAKACGVDSYAREQLNGRLDAMITNLERGQDDGLAVLATGDEEERAVKRKVAIEFGQQARQVSQELFARIEKFDVSTFGWIGFLLLLWTVISTLGSVETSFNEIWHVDVARKLWRRVVTYLFVLVVLPVLAALAMSLPILNVVKRALVATVGATSLTRWLSDGLIWVLESSFFSFSITLFFASLMFFLAFWLLPHRRIPIRPAAWGGLVTAIVFGCWWKVCAVAQVGIAKSSALYGSFAFVPILLAWIYMSWQVVLLGACFVRALEAQLSEPNDAPEVKEIDT